MVIEVAVGVALSRPPLIDEFRHIQVEAEGLGEARIIACQIAACTSMMPVWTGWPEDVAEVRESWLRQPHGG